MISQQQQGEMARKEVSNSCALEQPVRKTQTADGGSKDDTKNALREPQFNTCADQLLHEALLYFYKTALGPEEHTFKMKKLPCYPKEFTLLYNTSDESCFTPLSLTVQQVF